jgi:hypothetical protein
MLVTLGHTTNFVIQYDNKLKDGKRRAQALKSTCEADFAQLRSWFTTTGGFGPRTGPQYRSSAPASVPTANIRAAARCRDDPNNPEHPTSSTQTVTLYFESAQRQLRNARDLERNLSGPHLANH